jgi:hypothetical protein
LYMKKIVPLFNVSIKNHKVGYFISCVHPNVEAFS